MNPKDEMLQEFKAFRSSLETDYPELFPDVLAQKYDVRDCLAQKDGRAVYYAIQKETGQKCIIKITTAESPDRARHEHEILEKLNHPGIPKALDFFSDEQTDYLVREYAEGETLDKLVKRDGVFDESAVLSITGKLCDIIAYLHRQTPPVIYRDIKPQNVLVTANGRVTLIDFGIAKELDTEKSFDTVNVYSEGYASPEHMGFGQTDKRSDVYTLGKLMIYLAAGHNDIKAYIEKAPSSAMNKIIAKCVKLSPEQRYSSVEKLTKAIDSALTPPTKWQIGSAVVTACIVIAICFTAWWSIFNPLKSEIADVGAFPISAEGSEYSDLAKIPVEFTVLFDGKPFSDCAVAVDNHHWYAPASDGKAVLEVYPNDLYTSRAAYQNRVALIATPVTKDSDLHLVFDIGKTPTVDEVLWYTAPFGEYSEFSLPVGNTDDIELSNQPDGITVEKRNGAYILQVSEQIVQPGFYTFFLDATNQEGVATGVINLMLEKSKATITINSPAGLAAISDNLSGHYILTCDLDLSEYNNWTPIGTVGNPFTGIFDGGGYTISGLVSSTKGEDTGLFGTAKNAVIRNVIIEDADISAVHQAATSSIGIIVGTLNNSLLENSATIGGSVRTNVALDSSIGGVCGSNEGVIQNCFNSADVENKDSYGKDWTETYVGGVCGAMSGFTQNCGNTGNIQGISMTGGVAGFNDGGRLTRCYNAGTVEGIPFLSEYPSGGIVNLLGMGKSVSYCYFEKGSASIGAMVFNRGILLDLKPIDREEFRDPAKLANLGGFEQNSGAWAYASMDCYYPFPKGIFREQAEAPILPQSGSTIDILAKENVRYFYTIDGTNPYLSDPEGVDSVHITLTAGQTIQIFSAEKGKYDSPIVSYRAQ